MGVYSFPVLLLLSLQSMAARAEWWVMVELVNYTAPNYRCDSMHDGILQAKCDPVFHLCQGPNANLTCSNSVTYNNTNIILFGQEGSALFAPHIFPIMPANYTLDIKVLDADDGGHNSLSVHFHKQFFPNSTMVSGAVLPVLMKSGHYSLALNLVVECNPPYVGPHCDCRPVGHMMCNATTGHMYCAPGYAGHNCANATTLCLPSTCQNGGTCRETGTHGYYCHCSLGFWGLHCQNNVNECAHHPCQNGGTCVDGVHRYLCECPPGFLGTRCQTALDTSGQVVCQNGGSKEAGSNTCQCPAGYYGDACEIRVNRCLLKPCQNGGRCLSMADGIFECQCHYGYSGAQCQVDVTDPCSSPAYQGYCLHSGVCHSVLGGTPYCHCASGYKGQRCEVEGGHECRSSPCLNGGMCHEGVGYFTCSCLPGFVGHLCEIDTSHDILVG